MASPQQQTIDYDTYYTSTWAKMLGETPVDNIFDKNPLLAMMQSKGNIERYDGGFDGKCALEYGENDTVTSIGKGGTISLDDTDHLTTAIYNWKYVVGNVTRYFTEEKENAGKPRMINIVSSKLGNLKRSMETFLENALFGDGTGNGGLDPLGMDAIIREDPTASYTTVGGIDQQTYTWWRNQFQTGASRAVELYLLKDMRKVFNACCYNDEYPDYITSDLASMEKYEDETMEQKYIVNKTLGDAGFQHISYKGIPMTWSRKCKVNSMYFTNTDYLKIMSNMDSEFEMTDWKWATNNLDKVAQSVWGGNFYTSNRRMHGVYFNIGE